MTDIADTEEMTGRYNCYKQHTRVRLEATGREREDKKACHHRKGEK